jgi:Uma2 family endonuclease
VAGTPFAFEGSLEAFLVWEERQPEKYERVGGVVRAMAGGTEEHDRIGNNLRRELGGALRGRPCSYHGPDLKLTSPRGDVFYPDAFVRCGPRSGSATAHDDAVIVFEVLSESTAEHDLTRKRQAYQSIPTLKVIVYLSQKLARAHLVRRDADGHWTDEGVEGLDAVIELPVDGLRLALADLYDDTELARAAG